MAYESYKVTKGEVKRNATVTAPTGAETITATVGVGGIALIIEDTAALNQNDVINTIDKLRDLFMESNK